MRREEWPEVRDLIEGFWPTLGRRLMKAEAVDNAYYRALRTFPVAAVEDGLETVFSNRTDRRPPAPTELRAVVANLTSRSAARYREAQPDAMLEIAAQIEDGLVDRARHARAGTTMVLMQHSVLRNIEEIWGEMTKVERSPDRNAALVAAYHAQPVVGFVLYDRDARPGYSPGCLYVSWRDWEEWE